VNRTATARADLSNCPGTEHGDSPGLDDRRCPGCGICTGHSSRVYAPGIVCGCRQKRAGRRLQWDIFSSSGGGDCGYSAGSYHTARPQSGFSASCMAEAASYGKFLSRVLMTITGGSGGDGGGLIFRSAGNSASRLHIGLDGGYDLVALRRGGSRRVFFCRILVLTAATIWWHQGRRWHLAGVQQSEPGRTRQITWLLLHAATALISLSTENGSSLSQTPHPAQATSAFWVSISPAQQSTLSTATRRSGCSHLFEARPQLETVRPVHAR